MKSLIVVLAAVLLSSLPAGAQKPSARQLTGADRVAVVDGSSGKVLFAEGATQPVQVASLQKLVTALVIIEAGNLDKMVTITPGDASCPPTKLPQSTGGTYTRRELLQAMLVLSANDAARALARDNSGSEAAFGAKMTAMARRVGAKNSVFKDSAGFTVSGQYSTAADMIKILQAAFANPFIRQANSTKFLNWRQADGKMTQLRNSNRVLHRHPNCRAGKVGYTAAASHCVALVWEENGKTLYAVALGGKKEIFWLQFATVLKLLSHGLL